MEMESGIINTIVKFKKDTVELLYKSTESQKFVERNLAFMPKISHFVSIHSTGSRIVPTGFGWQMKNQS